VRTKKWIYEVHGYFDQALDPKFWETKGLNEKGGRSKSLSVAVKP